MADKNNNSGKYWPYLILGFIFIGLFLGFWTVRSAISMPVHESEAYQKKYQDADTNINKILEAQQRFDAQYTLKPVGFSPSSFKPKDYAIKHSKAVALTSGMVMQYRITTTGGQAVNDANVTLLITRPQTGAEDQTFQNLKCDNGTYSTPKVTLKNPGRYLLKLRAQIGDAVGFLDQEAFLQP